MHTKHSDDAISRWVCRTLTKKVKRRVLKFTSKELQQALQYAAHPEINAALVVLCDGRVFEIYDREESVTEPAARVEVANLASQFQTLQALLAPWQAWFFQKRRLLRLVDKVLDKEMNPGRLEEFKEAIQRRLEQKRGKVMENWRALHPISTDRSERDAALRGMSIKDLVEAEFFFNHPGADLHAIANLLAERARPGAFEVMYQVFPDRPRDISDNFVSAALRTLIQFDASGKTVNWLPAWLAPNAQEGGLEAGIKRLIALSLNTFDGDRDRKLVLQYAACARRMAKLSMALIPALTQAGQRNHELLRFSLDELHEAQYMSTPAGHNFRMLDGVQVRMTMEYVAKCYDDRENFSTNRAETMLRDLWQSERTLLADGTAYWRGLEGRGMTGEGNPTEHNWMDYDSLGHLALCVVRNSSEKWTQYIVQTHAAELERLAHGGSWQARELLAVPDDAKLPEPSEQELAQRFFCGDLGLFRDLRRSYRNRPRRA